MLKRDLFKLVRQNMPTRQRMKMVQVNKKILLIEVSTKMITTAREVTVGTFLHRARTRAVL